MVYDNMLVWTKTKFLLCFIGDFGYQQGKKF